MFEKLKTSVEACFLHNRIFINSWLSFHKENKITEHLFKILKTLKTSDSKQKIQKAQRDEKLVLQKN